MSQTVKQIGFAIFTFAVYTLLVNWKIALLLTVAVGWHEYSHLLAARYMKLKTKGFYLIPFMGGVALVAEKYKTQGQKAFVVLMGPVGGGLLALATAAMYWLTGELWLAAAAQWMLFLNLFNLLPLSFLDGGQLMDSITYSINKTLGMVCMTVSTLIAMVVLFRFNPIIAGLVIIFGGIQVITEIKNWNNFRLGKTYLVDENYLNKPKSLTRVQLVLVPLCWLLTIVVMGAVLLNLSNIPHADITYFFPKKPG